jgi:hypothetical protein
MAKGKPSIDNCVTVRTLRLRLKDKHASLLKEQAKEVTFVWNFTRELCLKHLERTGKFMSAFDVAEYTKDPERIWAGFPSSLWPLHAAMDRSITRALP